MRNRKKCAPGFGLATLTLISMLGLIGCTVSTSGGGLVISAGISNMSTPKEILPANNTGLQHEVNETALQSGKSTGNEKFNYIITKSEESDISAFLLKVFYKGKMVGEYESFLSEIDVDRMENTPSKAYKAFIAELYSGGVNCCYSNVLAIWSEEGDYLYYIDSALSLEDVTGDEVKELAIYDNYFKYYSPDNSHFLSGVEPILFVRYAIWTDNGWKLAAPGELREAYTNLMNGAIRDKEYYHKATQAIAITYYALMSGEIPLTARKLLKGRLPNDWKPITDKVFSDIMLCVSGNPRSEVSNVDVISRVQLDSKMRK